MEQLYLFEEDFNRLKERVKKNKDKEIIFNSDNDDLNRKVIEKLPINVLLIREGGRKDYSKQRNSGLNSVMAREMFKKGIIVGIDLDELIFSKEREKIIARVKQNIELAKKYKINMRFFSEKIKKDNRELKSLGLVLGMPTWMTKNL